MNHMNRGNEIKYNCVHNCKDQPSFDFISAVHMIHFIYITLITITVAKDYANVSDLCTLDRVGMLRHRTQLVLKSNLLVFCWSCKEKRTKNYQRNRATQRAKSTKSCRKAFLSTLW